MVQQKSNDKLLREKIQKYLLNPRMVFMSNGDRIKYGKNGIIEEAFSPRYGYELIPKEMIKEIKEYQYFWDFYGSHVVQASVGSIGRTRSQCHPEKNVLSYLQVIFSRTGELVISGITRVYMISNTKY
jgi:hypothetical protein